MLLMASGSEPVRWLLETRNVSSFPKLTRQLGRLPVILLPLMASVTSCGTEHKAIGKLPPIDVPSMTTARKTSLALPMLADAFEWYCRRNRLDGILPLSLGLFDSMMLMRDGKAHLDGTAPLKLLLCRRMDSTDGKLVNRQLGRLPVSALSYNHKSSSALAWQSPSGMRPLIGCFRVPAQ